MTKSEFLSELCRALGSVPENDIFERVNFYSEMIDDRIEEGMSEEEAVAAMGSVDDIASGIIADIPIGKLVREKIKPKRTLETWEILLLVLGSPLWISLLAAAFAILLALYAVLWSVVVCLWATEASLIGSALGGLVGGIVIAVVGNMLSGAALIGAALVCAGLSIFLLFGCLSATKGIARLSRAIVIRIKKMFVKKEGAQI